MNALSYVTQMCTAAIFYLSNCNNTKYIQAVNEMNNGLMNGGDYYRGTHQWEQNQYVHQHQLEQQQTNNAQEYQFYPQQYSTDPIEHAKLQALPTMVELPVNYSKYSIQRAF